VKGRLATVITVQKADISNKQGIALFVALIAVCFITSLISGYLAFSIASNVSNADKAK